VKQVCGRMAENILACAIMDAWIKHVDIDFGTYHHSTPKESKAIRESAEKALSKLLRPLYPSGAPLQILDAGCGLGFLMHVAAKCFPKARITGVDVFRSVSISEISMDEAASNMRSLGIDSRTSFLKQDLTKRMESDAQYDLAVSNLVFHNMGKRDLRRTRRFSMRSNPEGSSSSGICSRTTKPIWTTSVNARR
jgi:2-polyprenyl-3-methyl-5-hydroxy-6-metoxy-1,4-benzoquinol methylase